MPKKKKKSLGKYLNLMISRKLVTSTIDLRSILTYLQENMVWY